MKSQAQVLYKLNTMGHVYVLKMGLLTKDVLGMVGVDTKISKLTKHFLRIDLQG